MSTHLPLRICRPLHRQCVFQRPNLRPFSTTIARPGRGPVDNRRRRRVDPIQTEAAARHQGGKASSTVYEEQLSDERNLPDDIGLLPGTFIHAPIHKLPFLERFHKSLRERVWYEWKWLTSKVKTLVLLRRLKTTVPNCPNLYAIPWKRREITDMAKEKYLQLYRSFAQGDSKAISQLCLSTITQRFHSRIAARPRGLKMQWKVKGNVNAKVVSNRGLLLSLAGYENTGVQQIVVRLKSNQELNVIQGSETTGAMANEYSPKSGKVVEYMVLQRQVVRGVFKDWSVWGFADEWQPERITKDEAHERSLNAYQSAQAN